MKRIVSVIKQADQFGVAFQLKFQPDIDSFKSIQGGIATIIIYSIALAYFIYLFIAWQTNQFIPKITTTTIFRPEGNEIQLDYPPYRLNAAADEPDVWIHYNNSKNLFSSKSILYEEGNLLQFDKEEPNCNFQDFKQHSIALLPFFCMEKKQGFNMKVQQRPDNTSADSYYALEMHQCKNDDKCISSEEFEEFISNHRAYAQIEVLNKFYDHRTQQFQMIPNDYWLLINKELTIYFTMKLKITELEIDDGILFPNVKFHKYISKIDVIMQGTSWKTEDDPYVLAEVSVDRETQVIQIQYIKLSELLAQFSSILSTLLICGIIFNYYNSFQMKKLYLEQVGKVYYKNFSWAKEQSGIKRQQSLKSKSQTCPQDKNLKDSEEFLMKIEKQLLEKCSFIQILKEISKLQLAIAMILPKEKLEQVINMKFNLRKNLKDLGTKFNEQDQLFMIQSLYQFDQSQDKKQKSNIFQQQEVDLLSKRQEMENIMQVQSKSLDELIC